VRGSMGVFTHRGGPTGPGTWAETSAA
jgi:hypothetical protein